MSSMSEKENWLKGSQGLTITKKALIPFLEEHFTASSKKWGTDDTHIEHLLKLALTKEFKLVNKDGQIWTVNCSWCTPILEDLVKSHRIPKKLTWTNNDGPHKTVPNENRLAKIFMPKGNADCLSLIDRDSYAILKVFRNNIRLGFDGSEDLLEDLILFRNKIMHSNDNCITEDELTEAFSNMKELLEHDELKDRKECIEALNELSELQKKETSVTQEAMNQQAEEEIVREICKSNEIWKGAIEIQKLAVEKESTITPGALIRLVKDIKDELEKEKKQLKSMESTLQYTETELTETSLNLQTSKIRENIFSRRADSAKQEVGCLEEVEKLQNHSPTLARQVAKGAVSGTESNPNSKEAILVQKIAIEQERSKHLTNPEEYERKIENIKAELEKEKNQRKGIRELIESSRSESARQEFKRLESNYNQQRRRLHEENVKLQEEVKVFFVFVW